MLPLKRTLLVIGASSGIGRKTAECLLEQGHTVIGTSRKGARFKTPHSNFFPEILELSNLVTLLPRIKELTQKYPEIDALVFAAGYGQFGSLEEFSYPQIEQLITVNFTSQAFLTRGFLPQLKQKDRADLIYIGSEAALQGTQKGTLYCASKFALRGFTQALRQECAKTHLKVGLINPGMVKTPFFEPLNFEAGLQPEQHLQPIDVANAVLYLLNSTKNCVIDELTLNPLQKVVHFKKNNPR
jgi:NADP-dependent 3-hydroxy acid dehydrogenase YdfG